jgi:hypothetical protein
LFGNYLKIDGMKNHYGIIMAAWFKKVCPHKIMDSGYDANFWETLCQAAMPLKAITIRLLYIYFWKQKFQSWLLKSQNCVFERGD